MVQAAEVVVVWRFVGRLAVAFGRVQTAEVVVVAGLAERPSRSRVPLFLTARSRGGLAGLTDRLLTAVSPSASPRSTLALTRRPDPWWSNGCPVAVGLGLGRTLQPLFEPAPEAVVFAGLANRLVADGRMVSRLAVALGLGPRQPAEVVVLADVDQLAVASLAGSQPCSGLGQAAEVVVVAQTAAMGSRGTGRSRGG